MKQEIITKMNKQVNLTEFNSLEEFYNYITTIPFNNVFNYPNSRQSITGSKSFTETSNFTEATELFRNGWEVKAKELEQKLRIANQTMKPYTKQRAQFDVVGFQASVPRYLQGIPTNMVNKKNVVQKQKVITLNKNIAYHAAIKPEEIIEHSIKALQIIQKIEAQGIRCNLNIIVGIKSSSDYLYSDEINITKIRLKSANERLNVSKLAFPLIHPSILRRLYFRFMETSPTFTKNSYTRGYGYPIKENEENLYEFKGEYYLPRFIKGNIEDIVENILK